MSSVDIFQLPRSTSRGEAGVLSVSLSPKMLVKVFKSKFEILSPSCKSEVEKSFRSSALLLSVLGSDPRLSEPLIDPS